MDMEDDENLIQLIEDVRGRKAKDAIEDANVLNAPVINEPNIYDDPEHQSLRNIIKDVKGGKWKEADKDVRACSRAAMDIIPDGILRNIAELAKTDPTKAIEKLDFYNDHFNTAYYIGTIIRKNHVICYGQAVRRIKIVIQNLTDTPAFFNFDLRINTLTDKIIPLYRRLRKSRRQFYLVDGLGYQPVTVKVASHIVQEVYQAKHSDPTKLKPLIKWQNHRFEVLQSSEKPKVSNYPELQKALKKEM